MNQRQYANGEYPRLTSALALLERRGIVPDEEHYTTRELARELARRGWRWTFDAEKSSATKAYMPSGAVEHTITARGLDQVTALTLVLADAIRYDEEHGLSLAAPYRADIVVRDRSDNVIVLVEVKNREHLTSDVAVMFRRNLLTDRLLNRSIQFFLFVSQDRGILWDERSDPLPFAQPAKEFPMESIVAHYLSWFDPRERISGEALEFVVERWLNDLSQSRDDRPKDEEHYFDGTDFLDVIRGATVATQSPV